jgi:hemerythrin-like domain-containing protein
MLTATYTLVALSVEQASIRLSVLSFQKYMQSTLTRQHSLTLSQLEYACETLERLYQACSWRKVELYLIPALRQATERADQLLDELSRLNQFALGIVRRLKERLGQAEAPGADGDSAICEAIDTFCGTLLQRLEKEEQELFSIARSAICGEAWFAIANKLLAHDAQLAEARRNGDGGGGDVIALVPRLAPPAEPVAAIEIRMPAARLRERERSMSRTAAAD